MALIALIENVGYRHLDKDQPTPRLPEATAPAKPDTYSNSQAVSQTTGPAAQQAPLKSPNQRTKTHINGDKNVGGNNVTGNSNVTGNGNTTGPTASAPNGIAITGGNVTNPTVNNFAPPPPKPAVVTVCEGEPQMVSPDTGHDGEVKLILSVTTDSPVDNPTYGFQFSGTILKKGSSASSPDMAVNIKEDVTTPTSFAFELYQEWYPGQRMNIEVYSHQSVSLVNAVGKRSETFITKHGGCNSGL